MMISIRATNKRREDQMQGRMKQALSSAAAVEIGWHAGTAGALGLVSKFNPVAFAVEEGVGAVAAIGRGTYVYFHPQAAVS